MERIDDAWNPRPILSSTRQVRCNVKEVVHAGRTVDHHRLETFQSRTFVRVLCALYIMRKRLTSLESEAESNSAAIMAHFSKILFGNHL